MAIGSVSLTYFSLVGNPSSSAPVAAAPAIANDVPVAQTHNCEASARPRRNVLFEAMMSALRELGIGTTPATPASGAPAGSAAASAAAADAATAATPAAPSTAAPAAATAPAAESKPTPTLEDAVMSFAHALMQALRGGGSERGHDDEDEGHRHHHDHHGHRRHHGHRDRMTNDYSGLATRIEALATRLEASPATSPTTPTAPATPGSPVVPIVQIEPPVTTPKLESPADPVAQTALGKPASSVSASAGSTLFGAFEELMKLLKSLKPGADQTASASAPPSLTSFLHNLARGLDADRSAPSMTAVGMVINITA